MTQPGVVVLAAELSSRDVCIALHVDADWGQVTRRRDLLGESDARDEETDVYFFGHEILTLNM